MSTPEASPSPRDGFDTGSVSELAEDCRDVHLDVPEPRPSSAAHCDIAVPEQAAHLLDGMSSYGA